LGITPTAGLVSPGQVAQNRTEEVHDAGRSEILLPRMGSRVQVCTVAYTVENPHEIQTSFF
jgi:hypothetical protein